MCNLKKCYVCMEYCYLPANLPLKCNCKYDVHYDCIYKWYGIKPKCLICREYFDPPWPCILEDILYTITQLIKYFLLI